MKTSHTPLKNFVTKVNHPKAHQPTSSITISPRAIIEFDIKENSTDFEDDIFEKIDLDKFSQEINEKRNKMREVKEQQLLVSVPEAKDTNIHIKTEKMDPSKFDPLFPLDLDDIMLSEDIPGQRATPEMIKETKQEKSTLDTMVTFFNPRKHGQKRKFIPQSPGKTVRRENSQKRKKIEEEIQQFDKIQTEEIINDTLTPPDEVKDENLKKLYNYFGPKSYQRGWHYFHADHVFGIVKTISSDTKATSISSRCFGSNLEPYVQIITLESTTIVSTHCTCPISYKCKHCAAVLLTILQNKQSDMMSMSESLNDTQIKYDNLWTDYLHLFELYIREKQKVIQSKWVQHPLFDLFE